MITNKKDKKELLKIYVNYWYRATRYTEQKNDKKRDKPISVPIIPDEGFLNDRIEDLLELYDKDPIGIQ